MLKRRFFVAVLALAPLPACAQAQRWIEHRSAGGSYRVEMPEEPETTSDLVELTDGSSGTMTMASAYEGQLMFASTHTVFPAGYLAPDGQGELEQVRDGMAKSGVLVRERRLAVSGLPGLEYVLFSHGAYSVERTIVVGDCVYQVGVFNSSDADIDQDPDVRRFLDSFRLVPGPRLP